MLKLEMRTSPRLVQQIGAIERFAGVWERLAQSDVVASDKAQQSAIARGAEACMQLDATSPAGLALLIEVERVGNGPTFISQAEPSAIGSEEAFQPLNAAINAHLAPAEFDASGLNELFEVLTGGKPVGGVDGFVLRRSATFFTAPVSGPRGDEVVFPTVSPFLVQQRLDELLEWARHELEDGQFHPLFVIGTFHLLFLQIHPFPTANHRLGLILLWRLLDAHGYSYVRYSHLAPELASRSKQYFAALRQAEKTAYGNWSTLNIWLEFFLDMLVHASQHLLAVTERTVSNARLSQVQRRIIDVIKSSGSATRERIVTETGINLSTVKYNLSVLASRGHLRRDGGGRSTSYRLL